jgi:hypothetical protein
MLGVDVLPASQEPQELRGGDGLDLAPQPVQGVALDAGQQPAVAPGLASVEARAQHDALRLQLEQQRLLGGAGLDEDRSQCLEAAAQHRYRLPRRLDGEPAVALQDHAARREERLEPGPPRRRLRLRHVAHPEQRLVDLLGVLGTRPGLLLHAGHRVRIQRPHLLHRADVQDAPRHHGLRPALLEGRVVEEGVGLARQDAAGEGRRLRRVDGAALDGAVGEASQHLEEAVHVHGLGEAVLHGLAHDGVVLGHRDGAPGQGLGTGQRVGEGLGQEVLGPHPLDGGRHPPAVARPFQHQGPLGVPAPAGPEHRGGQQGLHQHVARGARMQVAEDLLQGEAVLRPQAEDDGLLVGGGLQLEAEADAEPLAQREAEGAVDARAEGGVDHELRPPGLVEEALQDHAALGRDAPQGLLAGEHVLGKLHRRGLAEGVAALVAQEGHGAGHRVSGVRAPFSQVRENRRELPGPPRSLAEPEGEMRRMRQEALPSWKMSPPLASTAQSSLTVPTTVPSGSRRTW